MREVESIINVIEDIESIVNFAHLVIPSVHILSSINPNSKHAPPCHQLTRMGLDLPESVFSHLRETVVTDEKLDQLLRTIQS